MYLPNCKLLTNNLLSNKKLSDELNCFMEGLQCRVPSDSWISFDLIKENGKYLAHLIVNSSTFCFSWKYSDLSLDSLLQRMKNNCDQKILVWHQERKIA